MYRLFFLIALFFLALFEPIRIKAEGFEGNIRIVCETIFDTTYLNLSIKGDMVRVDEYDNNRHLDISKIINLPEEEAIAISHSRKQYMGIPVTGQSEKVSKPVMGMKTGNYKEIHGYKCYQWRVKDVQRNTEIAYWVAEEKFEFLETLLKFMDNTAYSLRLYASSPDSNEFFPLLTEERTLLRKEKVRISVVEIKEVPVSSQVFEIPKGYNSVSRM